MREFQRIELPKSFKEMTFKRKLAVMLMFGFDGNSLRKKKEGIKEDAKIKSYFLFNYKKHHHHFTSQLLSLLKCLLPLHSWKNF